MSTFACAAFAEEHISSAVILYYCCVDEKGVVWAGPECVEEHHRVADGEFHQVFCSCFFQVDYAFAEVRCHLNYAVRRLFCV